jgi:FkbM family methyltransferase
MNKTGFLEAILAGEQPVCVDVGARSDIPALWLVLDGSARFVAFEPDPEACTALRAVYDGRGHGDMYRNLPIALSGTGGKRTLHVTNTPSGSSLLSPETELNLAYVDHDYIFPIRKREIETRKLGDVLDEVGETRADMIKIDVEGAALEVIQGLGEDKLKNVLCVELETAITQQFVNEATLFDIHAYMHKRGFDLLDMHQMHTVLTRNGRADGYQRTIFGVHAKSPTISGRLLDVDALFFRRSDDVLALGGNAVRRMAVAYGVYGFFCEAYDIVEKAARARLLDENEARIACDALVAWHDMPRLRKVFHRPTGFWGLVRQATKMVGMLDQVVDQVARGGAKEVASKVALRARQVVGGTIS